ncbi:oxysterol-binding protein, putative [Theileria equi strain WA]|uniref:Oxysterol-binding protein, putative n=1 Tax=Theileria equi strain WA TaxID=1537102 RepID=L0AUI9_THEEQ|nr:oxysterol-binding protein, putative [Theileria equi strain WA]AFZ79297.1 oxysterol-binding protein, putative [Theileria equi strain WA]|eukprot:XP_004828963.1 oxysterol-binding protein, putative [Theileria equi strain WA]
MPSQHKKKYIHEGWIHKWTNFIGSWRPRYFMLEPDYLMYSVEKGGIIKESFLLSNCEIRLCPDDPVRFDIEVIGTGLLCLRTDTSAEKHKWYASLKKAKSLSHPSYQKLVSTSNIYSLKRLIGRSQAPVPKEATSEPLSRSASIGDKKPESKQSETGPLKIESVKQRLLSESSIVEGNFEAKDTDESIDFSDLFIKTSVGREPKTPLSCIVDNTTSFDDISSKVLGELELISSRESVKHINTFRVLIKEYCSSIKQLYLEEMRSRDDLEQSMLLMSEQQTVSDEKDGSDPALELSSSIENNFSLKADEAASVRSDSFNQASSTDEFYECEDVRPSTKRSDTTSSSDSVSSLPKVEEKPVEKPKEEPKPPVTVVPIKRRTKLPHPRTELKVSIWSILKDLIGKDLSRISMPIILNEPTSSLQRSSEDFEYVSLLTEAYGKDTPVERLAYVTIFSITPYASAVGRTYKPFNPLLGETFELSHRGFKFIAEQVAHHPPICAFHCSSDEFEAYGTTNVVINFTGKAIEANILGPFLVNLKLDSGLEKYKLQRCYLIIHNIIFGKMWIEIVGTSIIKNVTDGAFSVVQYLKKGWFDKEIHKIRGLVFDKYGCPHFYLSGICSKYIFMEKVYPQASKTSRKILHEDGTLNFNKSLYKNEEDAWDAFVNEIDWNNINVVPNSKRQVWKPNVRPPGNEQYYGFGYITMELNELSDDYNPDKGAVMPITDSRFRPDQRAYENGNIDFASAEKRRLEEKQRAVAKSRTNSDISYKPMWFDKVIDKTTNQANWIFNNKYWEKKLDGTINDGVPDIFGSC